MAYWPFTCCTATAIGWRDWVDSSHVVGWRGLGPPGGVRFHLCVCLSIRHWLNHILSSISVVCGVLGSYSYGSRFRAKFERSLSYRASWESESSKDWDLRADHNGRNWSSTLWILSWGIALSASLLFICRDSYGLLLWMLLRPYN